MSSTVWIVLGVMAALTVFHLGTAWMGVQKAKREWESAGGKDA